jgi:hypothetical protein
MDANLKLAQWQDLKAEFPDPHERIEALFCSFFAPVSPCDVEYEAQLRVLSEILEVA